MNRRPTSLFHLRSLVLIVLLCNATLSTSFRYQLLSRCYQRPGGMMGRSGDQLVLFHCSGMTGNDDDGSSNDMMYDTAGSLTPRFRRVNDDDEESFSNEDDGSYCAPNLYQTVEGYFITPNCNTRREALRRIVVVMMGSPLLPIVLSSSSMVAAVSPSMAMDTTTRTSTTTISKPPHPTMFGVSDQVAASLVYETILGQGTYKNVYLVSGVDDETGNNVKFALAVQRLRVKADVKDAFRGVRIAEKLRSMMQRDDDQEFFETIEGWWVQSSSLAEFATKEVVFSTSLLREGRTKKEPGKFLGSKWLIALKPVYDMDLKRFAQKAPVLYPVVAEDEYSSILLRNEDIPVVAGIPLTQNSAMKLALDICHAGKLMHETGLVHRDIKPKNIMLHNGGRPVIIDFGFAQFGDTLRIDDKTTRVCVVQPGQVKGEVRYVLAQDVAKYRGCQEGDAYAMGKTLYEVFFGTAQGSEASGKLPITELEAKAQNDRFRGVLYRDEAGSKSRFRMSIDVRNILMGVIRGLCDEKEPISFARAEMILGVEGARM